jgi:hypothetical protein
MRSPPLCVGHNDSAPTRARVHQLTDLHDSERQRWHVNRCRLPASNRSSVPKRTLISSRTQDSHLATLVFVPSNLYYSPLRKDPCVTERFLEEALPPDDVMVTMIPAPEPHC